MKPVFATIVLLAIGKVYEVSPLGAAPMIYQ